ncbi:hypothetical protein [Actinomadura macrotermitis]|uniref:ATP-binding protein n=1 Tax=Actinomadura macrotermitis TaxID=2585200 RepID=A0A7K0BWI9_9ACTN|nr:hypothetical protein [Actinomadura macrotermitis]MQY05527.1 hypothetical protein [Actinomadura macrotermitis]
MNASAKKLITATALTPVAALVAAALSWAPAYATDGPVGELNKKVANRTVPDKAAKLTDRTVANVTGATRKTADDAVSRRTEEAGPITEAGRTAAGALEPVGGRVALTGSAADCARAADGTARDVTKAAKAAKHTGVAKALKDRKVPVAGRRASDPGAMVALGRNLRDPLGGSTGAATGLVSAPGTGGLGDALGPDCNPVRGLTGKGGAAHDTGLPGVGTKPGQFTKDLNVGGVAVAPAAPADSRSRRREVVSPADGLLDGLLGQLSGVRPGLLPGR